MPTAIGYNVGFGYQITKHFNVDVSYLFIKFFDRKAENTIPENSFDGTYKIDVNLIGVEPRLYVLTPQPLECFDEDHQLSSCCSLPPACFVGCVGYCRRTGRWPDSGSA